MRHLWGTRRRLALGLTAFGILGTVVLFVVLPAFATTPGAAIKPPSIPKGVTPVDVATGGQSNDCAVFGSSAANQYRISNPKDGTYKTTVNGVQVSFTLDMNPPNTNPSRPAYANDKYVSVTGSTGAAIVDIGIKGGTDEARYNYGGLFGNPNYGSVSSDGYLHAPAQSVDGQGNPTSLYSVSNLTFCFDLSGTVGGKVYRDTNQNGSFDSPGDTGLSGWTVNLRDHSTGTLVSSTTSAADGSYSFSKIFSTSTTYRICEAPPSGTWAQSQPAPAAPNSEVCSGSGELSRGYTFTPNSPTQAVTGQDFGNVTAQTCPPQPLGLPTYQVRLAVCKPENSYAFNSGTTPDGKPFVSVFASGPNQTKQPLLERITFPYDAAQGQNKLKLVYTDVFPFVPAAAHEMLYCQLDPRDLVADPTGLTLKAQYQADSAKTQILPSANAQDPNPTSCLITTTESADDTYVAFVYTDIDGFRGSG